MSEFCPENVNRSDATGASPEKETCGICGWQAIGKLAAKKMLVHKKFEHPAPASVAPQQEWTVEEKADSVTIYFGTHEDWMSTALANRGLLHEVCAAHNSRLREDKKEIEKLRARIKELKDHNAERIRLSDKRAASTDHPSPTDAN